ncbi:MAG: hypothetical protein H7A50_11775 [Akkermansiaceae bacterium]|nr:hypothetical protein [Akkermansiaceae bacterium]
MNFLHFAQSYGPAGNVANIDRAQATLLSTTPITTNGTSTYTPTPSIPTRRPIP